MAEERVVERQVIEVGLKGDRKAEQQLRKLAAAEREARDRLADLQLQEKKAGPAAKLHAEAVRKQRVEVEKLARERRTATQQARAEAQAERAAVQAQRQASAARVQNARAEAQAQKEAARADAERARNLDRLAAAHDRVDRARARERDNFRRLQAIGASISERQAAIEALDRRLALGPSLRERAAGFAGQAAAGARARIGGWTQSAGSVAGGLLTAGLAGAVGGSVALGRGAVQRGGDFVQQRAALEAQLGSREAADRRISEIRGIRGVGLTEGVQVANRLGGLGLNASAQSVRSVAAIAAATPGKSAMDFAEAVADAITLENERLKEFGIRAKVAGDKVSYTFRGVTETVGANAKEIQGYFDRLGQSSLFSGALERKAQGLQGALGSLDDELTVAATAIYEGGLSEALAEVVNEIASLVKESGGGAKAIGQVLGDAVRSLWAKVKELIGPVSELPEKIRAIVAVAADAVKLLLDLASAVGKVVETVGPGGVALGLLAVKIGAMTGPIGLATVGLLGLGAAIGAGMKAAVEAAGIFDKLGGAVEAYGRKQDALYESAKRQAETGRANESAERLRAGNQRADEADEAADKARLRFKEARLREMGLSENELTDEQRASLNAEADRVRFNLRRAGGLGGADEQRGAGEVNRAADALLGGTERRADSAELQRLVGKAKRKGARLTPQEKKRLDALRKKYDLSTPEKAGKPEVSAFGADVESEIKSQSEDAGRVAGLRAIRGGAGQKEADRIALRTQKETAERLRGQVNDGKFLPGQINASLLAVAGVDEVAGKGTPPPISVVNIGAPTVTIGDVNVSDFTTTATPDQLGVSVARAVQQEIRVAVRDGLRTAVRGIAI